MNPPMPLLTMTQRGGSVLKRLYLNPTLADIHQWMNLTQRYTARKRAKYPSFKTELERLQRELPEALENHQPNTTEEKV